MGTILRNLQRVQWTRLQAAGESTARAVPALLSGAALAQTKVRMGVLAGSLASAVVGGAVLAVCNARRRGA